MNILCDTYSEKPQHPKGQYDSCANGTGIGSRAERNCYIPTEKIYIHKDNETKQVG